MRTTDDVRQLVASVPSFSFGDTPEMADALLELVLSGRKRATSWAASLGTQGAEVGKISVIKDSKGRFRAMIETTELRLLRFGEVDEAFARDEGEGDLTLDCWRGEHRRCFEKEGTFSENMEVYCERFRLVEEIIPVL
jgi:uncharacterized protein YhfF